MVQLTNRRVILSGSSEKFQKEKILSEPEISLKHLKEPIFCHLLFKCFFLYSFTHCSPLFLYSVFVLLLISCTSCTIHCTHCCIKCPQILREKTSSQNSQGIALRIQWHFFHQNQMASRNRFCRQYLQNLNALIF